MVQSASSAVGVRIVAGADGTAWINGNGTWEDGTGSTFNALQAIVNSINATTGGWAPLEGTYLGTPYDTKLQPWLLTNYPANVFVTVGSGSAACVKTWASGFFTGKSFMVGCCGGHNDYNGIEMYRVRITDPPAACRMYDPPSPTINLGGGDWATDWAINPTTGQGVRAHHHYDGLLWDSTRQKGYFGAMSEALHSFNPNAATPKSAWELVSGGGSAWGYASFFMMNANELGYYSNTNGPCGVVNLDTGVRRNAVRPPDRLTLAGLGSSTVFFTSDYNYLCQSSTSGNIYHTTNSSVAGQSAYHFRRYTPSNHTANTPSAATALPTWYRPLNQSGGTSASYRTICMAAGSWGERIVFYHGVDTIDPFTGIPTGQGADYKVACFDPVANVVHSFESTATPRPTGSHNGNPAKRFGFVPEVKAFVALLRETESVWVFRPPSAWGIV